VRTKVYVFIFVIDQKLSDFADVAALEGVFPEFIAPALSAQEEVSAGLLSPKSIDNHLRVCPLTVTPSISYERGRANITFSTGQNQMIVVEGVDNSGKSTLVRSLSSMLPTFQIQVSEGPPKFAGEMDQRVGKYMGYPKNIIFDRHPCVSQPIYGQMRSHKDDIAPELIKSFYEMKPLFIYCDPLGRGLTTHVVKDDETPEHIAAVQSEYIRLLASYREWAINYATITYRIGDPMKRILKMVETMYGAA
jgi:hypothetical protein